MTYGDYVIIWGDYLRWLSHKNTTSRTLRKGVQNTNVRLTVHSIFQFKKYQQIIFFFKYKGLKKVRILSGLRTEKQR